MDRQQIEKRVKELAAEGGEWFYDMPLPEGVWTAGNQKVPHTRLKRIAQVVADLIDKPLAQSRILDLGSLEGLFSIEMAQQGAQAVGVEIRRFNLDKAEFVKETLGLTNV